jgi:hypothetical protein
MHAYFTGSARQRPPRHHLDLRSCGGYILSPPSQIDGTPRRSASAGNWCAGAALDDDLLDVPGYRPRTGYRSVDCLSTGRLTA